MSDIKNIFVSHYHTDAERIEDLKSLLGTHGMTMKDSSIYENKNWCGIKKVDILFSRIS